MIWPWSSSRDTGRAKWYGPQGSTGTLDGLEPVTLIGANKLLAPNPDTGSWVERRVPYESAVREIAQTLSLGELVCWDYEAGNLLAPEIAPDNPALVARRNILRWAREEAPQARHGLWQAPIGLTPEYHEVTPPEWRAANDRVADIIRAQDWAHVALYVHHDGEHLDQWEWDADCVAAEAERHGVPVVYWISPQSWPSGAWLPEADWRAMVRWAARRERAGIYVSHAVFHGDDERRWLAVWREETGH